MSSTIIQISSALPAICPRLVDGRDILVRGPTLRPRAASASPRRTRFAGFTARSRYQDLGLGAAAVLGGERCGVYSGASSRSVQPGSRCSPTSGSIAPILVRSATGVPSSARSGHPHSASRIVYLPAHSCGCHAPKPRASGRALRVSRTVVRAPLRSRRIVAVQGAVLVQHMHECPSQRKNRKMRPLKPQLLRTTKTFALQGRNGKETFSFAAASKSTANARFQPAASASACRYASPRPDWRRRPIWPAGAKTDKGQASQDCREAEPADDFGCGDHMAVQRGRIHLAIADRRQRLDAEEERIAETMRPSIGHGTRNQPKEGGEDNIQQQIRLQARLRGIVARLAQLRDDRDRAYRSAKHPSS